MVSLATLRGPLCTRRLAADLIERTRSPTSARFLLSRPAASCDGLETWASSPQRSVSHSGPVGRGPPRPLILLCICAAGGDPVPLPWELPSLHPETVHLLQVGCSASPDEPVAGSGGRNRGAPGGTQVCLAGTCRCRVSSFADVVFSPAGGLPGWWCSSHAVSRDESLAALGGRCDDASGAATGLIPDSAAIGGRFAASQV